MDQLLSIKHIPIKVEVKVTRAELRPVEDSGAKANSAPSVQVTGKNGRLCLKADPYRIDLSESRNYDTYVPSGSYDDGITLTYEAVARLADGGNAAKGLKSGIAADGEAQRLHARKASRSIESMLQSLPKSRNSAVSYSDGTLSINYQMSMSSAQSQELALSSPEFEFIPGSIEFIISQMPELDIEYLGDPIYFPRSADPNYEPVVDVLA